MKIMKTTFQQTVKNSLRNIESFDYNSNTDPITVFHPKNSALFNHNATHKTTTKSKPQSQTFESPKPKPHIYTSSTISNSPRGVKSITLRMAHAENLHHLRSLMHRANLCALLSRGPYI